MWFGITYLGEDDVAGEEQVIVSVWDGDRPLRVGGQARSVADIVCALREAGGTSTAMPRCDACGAAFDVPDLDADSREAARGTCSHTSTTSRNGGGRNPIPTKRSTSFPSAGVSPW